MAKTIKTTGQLREFLANMMIGVKDGLVEPDRAHKITKMAAQINESFYSEIKIQKIQLETKQEPKLLGELPLNKTEAE